MLLRPELLGRRRRYRRKQWNATGSIPIKHADDVLFSCFRQSPALHDMSSFTDSIHPGIGFNPRAYLEKFGYAQGKGLGKNEDGMKTHIAVQKKDDAKGVSRAVQQSDMCAAK
jgi:hypothetical protein